MANCTFCNYPLSNNKSVAWRCAACGTVWCANGNCVGSLNKRLGSRIQGATCPCCHKREIERL